MIVVSDTSAITNLLKIGEVEILGSVFGRVIIPRSVRDEICGIDSQAKAIALALELSADYLLIDETEGRGIARSMGIRITGLLGVLLRAKQDGHIERVRPCIDRLVIEARFRLSEDLIKAVLYQAGE